MLTIKLVLIILSSPLILYITFAPKIERYLAESFERSPPFANESVFDFIVVGSGSAGSVVAGRLAEQGHSVLVLESGGNSNRLQSIPILAPFFQLTDYDWQYK